MNLPPPSKKKPREFDLVRFEDDWFVRFPFEAKFVHFGKIRTEALCRLILIIAGRNDPGTVTRPLVVDMARLLLTFDIDGTNIESYLVTHGESASF